MQKGLILLLCLIGLSGISAAQQASSSDFHITGTTTIAAGQGTKLAVTGPNVTNLKWTWFIDRCGGAPIASGYSLLVSPNQTTTYYARREGSARCIPITVYVNNNSVAPDEIMGRGLICRGEKNVKLSVLGGILGKGAHWAWYEGGCNGRKVGEGPSLLVSPVQSTQYFVRSEGGSNTTECRSFTVNVANLSVKPDRISGPDVVQANQPFSLRVDGGKLADGATWTWYKGTATNKTEIGKGVVLNNVETEKSTTFFVTAESDCGQTEFTVKTVTVKAPVLQTLASRNSQPVTFFNLGFVNNNIRDLNSLANVSLTVGGGGTLGWYGRAKMSVSQAKSTYETDNTGLTDYNENGYYQFSGNVVNKRYGVTGGIMYNFEPISVYVGAGYGIRELQWEIRQFSYGSNEELSKAWARNVPSSFEGPEVEGGIMVRAGFINFLVGIGSVNFKYIDAHAGIGYNFK
jgi:hypothetical protein